MKSTIRTARKLAAAMGVHHTTVLNWKKRGDMPVEADGSFDPEKIARWRSEWDDQLTEDGAGDIGDGESLRFWDIQFRKFRAKREELEFQVRQGELVPRTQLVELLVSRAVEFRRELLGRARRLSLRIAHKPSKEVAAALEEDSLQILRKYSR